VESGRVLLDGVDLRSLKGEQLRRVRWSRLSFVPQGAMNALNPMLQVEDQLRDAITSHEGRQSRRRLRPRLLELLDAVGLPADAGRRYPHQFSGGQRQRISIARALSTHPSVLVADEPVSALDVSVRAQILNLIADLADAYGLTLVFVSHDLSVVRHVCDTIAVMREGEIVELGPAKQVADAPTHPYTRRLVAAVPTIAGALAGRTAADLARGAEEEVA
jgi:ABC-type glutathione transport system ATPase component